MQKTLIEFWFGPLTGPEAFNRDRYDLWFQNGRAYDGTIRERFGDLWRRAEAGDLDDWAETAQGRLALILLLDQVFCCSIRCPATFTGVRRRRSRRIIAPKR